MGLRALIQDVVGAFQPGKSAQSLIGPARQRAYTRPMNWLRLVTAATFALPAAVWAQDTSAFERCLDEAKRVAEGSDTTDGGAYARCIEKNINVKKSPAPAALSADVEARPAQAVAAASGRSRRAARAAARGPVRAAIAPAEEAAIATQPAPASSSASTAATAMPNRVADAEFARITKDTPYGEVTRILGRPYSRIEGDEVRLTYLLESGKRGQVTIENRAVTAARIVD